MLLQHLVVDMLKTSIVKTNVFSNIILRNVVTPFVLATLFLEECKTNTHLRLRRVAGGAVDHQRLAASRRAQLEVAAVRLDEQHATARELLGKIAARAAPCQWR